MQPTEQEVATQGKIVGYFRRRNNWLAGFVCVCAAATPFARHFWVVDIIANLRVQLILGLMAVAAISLILRQWRIAILVAAVMMGQATWLMSAFQSAPNLRRSTEHTDAVATTVKCYRPTGRTIERLSFTFHQLIRVDFLSDATCLYYSLTLWVKTSDKEALCNQTRFSITRSEYKRKSS